MNNFKQLSRAEMKNVRGGENLSPSCKVGTCSLYVEALGQTLQGTCGGQSTEPTTWNCVCYAGGYQTNNGGTSCVYYG